MHVHVVTIKKLLKVIMVLNSGFKYPSKQLCIFSVLFQILRKLYKNFPSHIEDASFIAFKSQLEHLENNACRSSALNSPKTFIKITAKFKIQKLWNKDSKSDGN